MRTDRPCAPRLRPPRRGARKRRYGPVPYSKALYYKRGRVIERGGRRDGIRRARLIQRPRGPVRPNEGDGARIWRRIRGSAYSGVGKIQAWLLWGLLFGSIGLGFFIYGRNQRAVVPLVCGVALMVFPYLVSNVVLLVGIGALLIAIPFFFRP